MAIHHKLIAFDRPLVAAVGPGSGGRMFTETELSHAREEAYRQGADSAQAFASQQLVEFRADVQALQEGLFARLGTLEQDLVAQLQTSLPMLVVDIARRLLANYEPTAEQVQALSVEALMQVFPEHEGLELYISPRDAVLLDTVNPEWKNRFPDLKIVADATLKAGDVQVRSRFGLTDATRQAKLETLSRELLSA